MKSQECQLEAAEVDKIVLSKFEEKDPLQHIMKVLFGCGLYAAFRGSKEHTFFLKTQVKIGVYPQNFENPDLVGMRYAAIDHMLSEKACKVTVNNSYARNCGNFMRFPIVEGDMNNFGGAIERLLKKMHPKQVRMYCKPAPPGKRMEYLNDGYPNAEFYEDVVLGENTIRDLFRKGAVILGIKNPHKFKPHSLRGACITSLVNDQSVSLAETMQVAHHSSASASKVYQRVDGISESNRLNAMGQLPVPKKKKATKKKNVLESDSDSDIFSVSSTGAAGGVAKKCDDGSVSSMSSIALKCSVKAKKKNIYVLDDSSDSDDQSVKEVKKYKTAGLEDSANTQEDMDALKDQIADLHDLMANGIPTDPKKSNKVSLTQVNIHELEEKIDGLREKIDRATSARRSPPMSENRREVQRLRGIVDSLTKRLEFQELYAGSLENDLDNDVRNLKAELMAERAARREAERENHEFQEFLWRDMKRGTEVDRVSRREKKRSRKKY